MSCAPTDTRADSAYRMPAWLVQKLAGAPEVTASLQKPESGEARWQAGLTALDAFVAREHHSRVPMTHVEAGYPVGTWVSAARTRQRSGTMSAERMRALESRAGWVWNEQTAGFADGLSALDSFIRRTGHARVPHTHVEAEFLLGAFIQRNRTMHGKGTLPAERAVALESRAGWVWSAQDAGFADGLSALDSFIRRTGHARVPATHLEGEFKLGTWTGSNRKSWRLGRMPAERAAALEARAGWAWNLQSQGFVDGLAALDLFISRMGHARVPVAHFEGEMNLGQWVKTIRLAKQLGKLTDSRITALESRAGWVWAVRAATVHG